MLISVFELQPVLKFKHVPKFAEALFLSGSNLLQNLAVIIDHDFTIFIDVLDEGCFPELEILRKSRDIQLFVEGLL